MREMREAFIKGLFFACVILFLIGGAALDAEPVIGSVICLVSLAIGALIYVQNVGGSLLYEDRERRSRR